MMAAKKSIPNSRIHGRLVAPSLHRQTRGSAIKAPTNANVSHPSQPSADFMVISSFSGAPEQCRDATARIAQLFYGRSAAGL
jgi:hypothetical protein